MLSQGKRHRGRSGEISHRFAGFVAECARISALGGNDEQTKPGTLGLLIKRYRAHPAFTDLAQRTQADYQRCFDYLQPIADTALERFTRPSW